MITLACLRLLNNLMIVFDALPASGPGDLRVTGFIPITLSPGEECVVMGLIVCMFVCVCPRAKIKKLTRGSGLL